jgi:agmatinase
MTDAKHTATPIRGFLDWPVATDPGRWAADVVLCGIQHSEPYARDPRPNDQARAPDAIRLRSLNISYGPEQWDFDLGGPLAALTPRCLDIGNIGWGGGSYDDYAADITARARHLWRQGTQIFILGGDHGVTIPVLDALDALGESVHIVHVDAHLDWREEVGGVRRGYSSPLRWASTKASVSGMTQIGMRQTGSARRAEVNAAREYGSHVFPADQLHEHGWTSVLATIPRGRAVYLTIDADGLDPTEMPAVMAPCPGGILYRELAPVLRRIAREHRVVGMDVVEVAPSYDSANGITSIMAGRLIVNVLGASWAADGAMRRAKAARETRAATSIPDPGSPTIA